MINNAEFQEEIGDNHIATNAQNPIRKDAFSISDEEKIAKANAHVDFELISTAWVETDPDMDKKSLAEWKDYRKKISSFKNSKDVSEVTWPKRPLVELEKIMEEDSIA